MFVLCNGKGACNECSFKKTTLLSIGELSPSDSPILPNSPPSQAAKRQKRDEDEKQMQAFSTGLLSTVGESDFSGLSYTPRTRETKAVFEVVLSFIQSYIGEQPREILLGAADEVLLSIKQTANRKEQLSEVKNLLEDITEDRLVCFWLKSFYFSLNGHSTSKSPLSLFPFTYSI